MIPGFCSHCMRCGADLARVPSTVSRFSTENICLTCEQEERKAPNYAEAHRVELEAVRRGDYNFPGIGLRPEDEAFLVECRAERARAAT